MNEGKGQKVQPTPQSQPQKAPQQESDSNGCYHCGKPGDRRSDCIKFIKWLARKGNDEVTFIDESFYVNYATNSWWIESGATIHVTNSLQGFVKRKTLRRGDRSIKVANGAMAEAEAVGTLPLRLDNGYILQLNNVIYVPSLSRNLISISVLDNEGYSCNIGNRQCNIFYGSYHVGLAIRQDKLYLLSIDDSSMSMNACDGIKRKRTDDETSSKLWHCRLGHISRGRIERLIKEQILHPLDFSDADTCIDCIKGKYVKQIKKGATRSAGILELIHTDICGPIPVKSIDGFDSFITFTDDYSRYGYIYPIKDRSESLDKFKIFKAEIENQHNLKIKVVRSY